MALSDIGLVKDVERLYRALLAYPSVDLAGLMERLGVGDIELGEHLRALEDLGLIEVVATGARVIRPSIALSRLIEKHEDDLAAAQRRVASTRSDLAQLDQLFVAKPRDSAEDSGVEKVTGLDQVRERIEELSFFARASVDAVQPGGPQSAEALASSRPLDLRASRRRIQMRLVHHESVLDDALNREYLQELVTLGTAVRLTDRPITRMLIFDEQVAVVPIDPLNSRRGALIVRQDGLVGGFLDLFRQTWDAAHELPIADSGESTPTDDDEITDQDRQVLALLASGRTDEVAARTAGVSVRHLRRRISRLMVILDAGSRFEAGVEAARRGWI